MSQATIRGSNPLRSTIGVNGPSEKSTSKHENGPIVYRLGCCPFKAEERVRISLGLPSGYGNSTLSSMNAVTTMNPGNGLVAQLVERPVEAREAWVRFPPRPPCESSVQRLAQMLPKHLARVRIPSLALARTALTKPRSVQFGVDAALSRRRSRVQIPYRGLLESGSLPSSKKRMTEQSPLTTWGIR